jgi:hypothetical protein
VQAFHEAKGCQIVAMDDQSVVLRLAIRRGQRLKSHAVAPSRRDPVDHCGEREKFG